MDIRQITGFGGVERTPERSARTERPKAADGQPGARPQDGATISDAGRETAASIDALTEQARREDPDRQAKLATLRKRLESGELSTPAVFRSVAKTMIDTGAF